jgi:hypothetical protein
MIQYLLAGFELELYSCHEYHYIYWYLYEFLYGWMTSALSRADSFLIEQESLSEQQKTRNAKKVKKKKKSRPHGREVLFNQAQQSLCGGYYKAVVGFSIHGKLRKPGFQFDNEQVRYEHRFAAFGSVLTPPPVQYVQFKEMSDMHRCGFISFTLPTDLYSAAAKDFSQARVLLEGLASTAAKEYTQPRGLLDGLAPSNEEIATLVKVAKMNLIMMNLLVGGHKHDSKDPPEFDFSIHKVFPVIKV